MIDNFVLALTHGLMLLGAWRILFRRDLDDDGAPAETTRGPAAAWAKLRGKANADRA
ncbi:hypothetical protein [Sphingomonas parva]|uniref:hypothetical protein n=1 Tax=Sphingomonas parva TaxID=2555898 RepID=UPI00143015FD|nr:hypothetical protein [Sphingomonas parva]